MFQFPTFPLYDYFIHRTVVEVCSTGFPHSDIRGSMDICSSPRLFAAYHVLLRLLVPRHPPYALLRLILKWFSLFLFELPLSRPLSFVKSFSRFKKDLQKMSFWLNHINIDCSMLLDCSWSMCNFQGSSSEFASRINSVISYACTYVYL